MLILVLQMTSCIVIPLKKKVNVRYDVSEITAIQIYNLGDQVLRKFEFMELMGQNFMPVATLEADQYADFVAELGSLTFTDTIVIVVASVSYDDSFHGYVAKVSYQNGECDYLSCGVQLYNAGDDNDTYMDHYYCEESEWDVFIKAYLNDN